MNLKEIARSRGTNLKRIAEQCNIPPSTLYAISSGDTNFDNVGISIAIKVAESLGMTVEELYTGKEQPKNEPLTLSPDERKLVDLFRRMDDAQQAKYLGLAPTFVVASEKDGAGSREDAAMAGRAVK